MSGIKGAVEIKGRGSDLELEDVAGEVNIDGVYTGTIELRKLAKPVHFTGTQTELNIESVPGQVSITPGDFTASKVTGPTHLAGRSRDVEINDFTGPLDVTLERGDLSLRPALPLGRIQAHSRSGDIRLSLPAGAQFALNASTGNGDISNQFGGDSLSTPKAAAEPCGDRWAAVRRSNWKRSAGTSPCKRLSSQAAIHRSKS